MKTIKIKYNKEDDTLYIYFTKNRPAITIELGNDMLLRQDPVTNEIISLEIMFFSKNKIEFEIEKKGGKYGHPLTKFRCYDCGSMLRIGGAISEGVGENAKADDIFFCENCEAVYYGKKELSLPKNKRQP